MHSEDSHESYYKTIAMMLPYNNIAIVMYKGHKICAHPQPDIIDTSAIDPFTLGHISHSLVPVECDLEDNNDLVLIWKLLMAIDELPSFIDESIPPS